MLTVINTNVVINGKVMKEVKNMVKGIGKKELLFDYLKFNCKDEQLFVTMINNNFTIVKAFEIENHINGCKQFLIPIDLIKGETGVKNTDKYQFTILEDDKIEFIKNNARRILNTESVTNYPRVPNLEFKYIDTIDYNDILKMNKALLSVSKSDARPVLKHVLIRDGHIWTTDSFRLYRNSININYDNDLVLSAVGIKKLKDMFNKNDSITVNVHDQCIKFENENTTIYINLCSDGNYPEVNRLLPTDFNTEFIVDASVLKQSIKDAKTIVKKEKNQVVTFNISQNVLSITAKSDMNGEYSNTIDIHDFAGEEISVSFNASYLLDAIDQIDGDSLVLKFNGNVRPFIVKDNDYKNEATSLILPVRIP